MRLVRSMLLMGAVLALAGCETVPLAAPHKVAPLTPMALRVSDVLVDDETAPAMDAARVESKLLPTPADAVRDLLESHYQAGLSGRVGAPAVRFAIAEASVTETKLAPPEGEGQIKKMLRNAPDTQYDGRVVVRAQLGATGVARGGYVQAEATRQLQLGNVTGDERMAQLNAMVAEMAHDAVAALDQQILDHLGGIVGGAAGMSSGSLMVTPQPSGRWDHVYNWK